MKISYITSHPIFTGSLELTNDQLPTSVASYLSWLEHCTGIARSRVQTPLKSWLFKASMRNCLNCVHNCDDHSLLDSSWHCSFLKHWLQASSSPVSCMWHFQGQLLKSLSYCWAFFFYFALSTNPNILRGMTYLQSYLHFRFPAPSIRFKCHAMNQKHCVTMYSGCFLLIKVLVVMLFVFFFDCKSFTLVIVAHFRSLYRSYSLFSNMMPWHLSMCQVIWNTHFGESKLTKLTCFLLKISWNYFLLYTRWEWISMINLQERENEFSLLKSLYT